MQLQFELRAILHVNRRCRLEGMMRVLGMLGMIRRGGFGIMRAKNSIKVACCRRCRRHIGHFIRALIGSCSCGCRTCGRHFFFFFFTLAITGMSLLILVSTALALCFFLVVCINLNCVCRIDIAGIGIRIRIGVEKVLLVNWVSCDDGAVMNAIERGGVFMIGCHGINPRSIGKMMMTIIVMMKKMMIIIVVILLKSIVFLFLLF